MSGKTVSLTKAAKGLRVSTMTLRRWMASGKVPTPAKVRGKFRVSPEHMKRFRAYKDSGEVKGED